MFMLLQKLILEIQGIQQKIHRFFFIPKQMTKLSVYSFSGLDVGS
jgi:hypothetical protein